MTLQARRSRLFQVAIYPELEFQTTMGRTKNCKNNIHKNDSTNEIMIVVSIKMHRTFPESFHAVAPPWDRPGHETLKFQTRAGFESFLLCNSLVAKTV